MCSVPQEYNQTRGTDTGGCSIWPLKIDQLIIQLETVPVSGPAS